MTDNADEIRSSFANMETEEILARLKRGSLTETATLIASEELKARELKALNSGDIADFVEAQKDHPASQPLTAEEVVVLRKRSRRNYLYGGMALVLLFRLFEHFALGKDTLGYGVGFAIGLVGNVLIGGLLWGYVAWLAFARWRIR